MMQADHFCAKQGRREKEERDRPIELSKLAVCSERKRVRSWRREKIEHPKKKKEEEDDETMKQCLSSLLSVF